MNKERTSLLGLITPAAGYFLALLATLWIVGGRALFGAGGSLVPVFAVSFGPMLLLVMGLATWMIRLEAALYQRMLGFGTPTTTGLIALVYWGSFLMALIFGFLVPDRMDGRVVSAASQVLGDAWVGLSAGFGNTVGILTLCLAFGAFFLALTEKKKTDRTLAGVDADAEEAAAREAYTYDFLD